MKIRVFFGALAAFLLPSAALAHAFGQQFTLPLPLSFYIGGGMMAFIASCVILLIFSNPQGAHDKQIGRVFSFKAPFFVKTLSVFGIAFFILSIFVGLLGLQDYTENPLPDLFWIIFLLLFIYINAVIGGLWNFINPFKKVAAYFAPDSAVRPETPQWFPYIPAILFLAFLWLELFSWGLGAIPGVLAVVLLGYAFFCIVMSKIIGLRAWFEQGDFFSTLFGIVSKAAPIQIDDKTIALAPPGERLVHETAPHMGVLFFILVMLGSTVFDGLKESAFWWNLIFRLNLGDATLFYIVDLVTLVVLPFLLLWFYSIAIWGMQALVSSPMSIRELSLRFAYSLVPIAIAYHFAHYFSLILSQGQYFVANISDPFSQGWNLFGTADYQMNPGIVGADTVWYLQLGVIVLGHILAAIVAHRISLKMFKTRREVVLSQLPMLVLMVFYTVFGLWTLAQPFVGA